MTRADGYLKHFRGFTFSVITTFEITRGLKIRNAERQLHKFESLRKHSLELSLNHDVIERASSIYAELYQAGNLIGDADILIAATAIENRLPVVTNNESHFGRIPGLRLLNWNR